MKLFMILLAAVAIYSGLNLSGLVEMYQATNDISLIAGVIKYLLTTAGTAGLLMVLAIRNW
jgi:rhamnogalacturonyl hydrolase YesR